MFLLRALLLLVLSPLALAEQFVETDKYIIHYNAFNSTLVAPDVANLHQLPRSRFTAMLNVAVLEKQADGTTKAVPAALSAKVANLMQQTQQLTFTTIKEGDALYYIGTFNFGNEEVMHLFIDVTPEGSKMPVKIRFDQKFYKD